MSIAATLYYAHDPMCSWCWGFRPCWQQLQAGLSEDVQVRYLLGGLAADTDQPMDEQMRLFLQNTWRNIQQRIPGTRFNFIFWDICTPRRSTYPACRAVIAARRQSPSGEQTMILAIQRAYYEQARNPSEHATLIELARESGLDAARFTQDLHSAATEQALQQEILTSQRLGMQAFPSLQLEVRGSRWPLPIDYTNAHTMLANIADLLA
jgi:putative protein-disulfide isomerase